MESTRPCAPELGEEMRRPRGPVRYIPSLDGLRAVSISLVVLSHLRGTRHFPLPAAVTDFFELGPLGVRVFFVISGFLITKLLLQEIDETGRVRLGRFYLRRTLRIFPPYYVLLAVVFALGAAGRITLAPHDILRSATYTSNYYADSSWYVGHTWSLSVEEQFYLLWPAILLLAGGRRGLWGAFAFVLVSPPLRLAIYHLDPHYPNGRTFETAADSIAVGCLLAGARGWLHSLPPYRRLLGSRLFALVPFCVLLASGLWARPRIYYFFAFPLMNLGTALCLDRCVTYCGGHIGRLLNSRPLVFLGVMSYSIYLWQQLFIDRSSGSALAQFPVNLLMVAACALASYYLVERPALAARRRLEGRILPRRATTPRAPRLPVPRSRPPT